MKKSYMGGETYFYFQQETPAKYIDEIARLLKS